MNDIEILKYLPDLKNNELDLCFYVEVLKDETDIRDAIHGGYLLSFVYPAGKLRDIAGSDAVKIYGDELYNTIINVDDRCIISTIVKCYGYEDKSCLLYIFKQPHGRLLGRPLVRGWVIYEDDDPELIKKVEDTWNRKVCESRLLFGGSM